MQKVFCDKCGAEVETPYFVSLTDYGNIAEGYEGQRTVKYELCAPCFQNIYDQLMEATK